MLMVAATLWLHPVGTVLAQTTPEMPCPAAADVQSRDLLGFWVAEFDRPSLSRATLLLEPSKEYADGLSGAISRDGSKAFVAGDIEDGEFTLEESIDGQHISATWTGQPSACGREIRGIWRNAAPYEEAPFLLRRRSP